MISWLRTHKATRYIGRVLAICGVILAVTIVSTVTVDLGPAVRRLAEREGSRRIARPIHIDRLSIHLLRGPDGERTVPATEFFLGLYETAADPGEMITEVWFPRPARQAALTEFAQRQGDFAIVAAAVSAQVTDGTCDAVRVVLGGVGTRPLLLDTDELAGAPATAATWRAAGELAAAVVDRAQQPGKIVRAQLGTSGCRALVLPHTPIVPRPVPRRVRATSPSGSRRPSSRRAAGTGGRRTGCPARRFRAR